jgi:hypothetical protein
MGLLFFLVPLVRWRLLHREGFQRGDLQPELGEREQVVEVVMEPTLELVVLVGQFAYMLQIDYRNTDKAIVFARTKW